MLYNTLIRYFLNRAETRIADPDFFGSFGFGWTRIVDPPSLYNFKIIKKEMFLFCKYALFSAIYSFVNAFTHFKHYKMIMKEILNVLSKNITAKSMVIFFSAYLYVLHIVSYLYTVPVHTLLVHRRNTHYFL